MRARRAAPVLALAAACAHVSGHVTSVGGPVPDWSLRPNRCKVGDPLPAWGGDALVAAPPRVADLYYAGSHPADTELVVSHGGGHPYLLVRIPGAEKMVVLGQADCRVLEVSMGYTGYTVNDEAGLSGSARFDCQRSEIGHVKGNVSFTCF